jgi:hypothetical protein
MVFDPVSLPLVRTGVSVGAGGVVSTVTGNVPENASFPAWSRIRIW